MNEPGAGFGVLLLKKKTFRIITAFSFNESLVGDIMSVVQSHI